MDENSEISVYNLITNLCEKFSVGQSDVKKLRSTAYEILLKKRTCDSISNFRDLKGPDAYCDLLAWQFTLSTKYGLVEHARSLKEYGEYVQTHYGNEIIEFLLCLRDVPVEDDDLFELNIPKSLQSLYKIASTAKSEVSTYAFNVEEDPPHSPDIWEIASKESYSNRKTWEDFGHAEPDKEKPFLSELDSSDLWILNLPSVYYSTIKTENGTHIKPNIKSVAEFVRDVKYLLVGMASYFFSYTENGDFFLVPNITVTGLTPSILKSFSEELIFCGTCYKALHEMSTPNRISGKYKQDGYIFAELCNSIESFLEYYRTAIISLPDNVGLLYLHKRTTQLRIQLTTLTEVCKIGPYSESERIPHGVSLLNYLYQTVLSLTDKNVLLVLYAILFPCCQVYFLRFLQQWLLEGRVNDPYEEFFIKPNFKYISTRGRTYWTRSYSLREDIVPDFLVHLRMDILNCGKAMNLLKLCAPSSKLCLYLMGKNPLIISCCVTGEQLLLLEQNTTSYYLEVLSDCGPIMHLEEVLSQRKEQDPAFLNLIAKKRLMTLKRLELERKKVLEEEKEKKLEEITALKEQYDSALRVKELRVASEIERELKELEINLSIDNFREKLIEKEATELINYYNNLSEISDRRRRKIEIHIERLRNCSLEHTVVEAKSSEESFYSCIEEESVETESDVKSVRSEQFEEEIVDLKPVHSSKSLDIINANCYKSSGDTTLETFAMAKKIKNKVLSEEMGIITAPVTSNANNVNNTQSTAFQSSLETFAMARKIKEKVLSSELGIIPPSVLNTKPYTKNINTNLTEAQKNKLKVLGTELGIEIPVPMSVDTTPVSETVATEESFPLDDIVEPASLPLKPSVATTPISETQATDEGFGMDEISEVSTTDIKPAEKVAFGESSFVALSESNVQKKAFSKVVTPEKVSGLGTNCLKLFLRESISVPLTTQLKVVESELLKFFVDDLHYFQHLDSLRDYFFLQNGEFGRNITENLFEKLYEVHSPNELMNFRTLQKMVFEALETSNKFEESSNHLAFKINSLPKRFYLGDPDVLSCLSLTYKVKWPLNILLPSDTIAKYDEVFKYLLKLNRISWVLKKILLELKLLAKLSGKKEIYLMMSPHYRRLHQCRHVMLHFIQTLQNYIVGEVLQSSWEIFETNLSAVTNVDSLYSIHTTYIKNILFLCLLNQKSTPLRTVIQKIFIVILKFYDYLRSRSWKCEDGIYVHPNFTKLESIFLNFEEFVLYLFKIGRKVAKSGYQPHLTQLLDMLDVNGYYSKKNSVHVT